MHSSPLRLLTLLCLALGAGRIFSADPAASLDIPGNLALVPATDPAPQNPPSVRAEMRGVHPRLLFTKAEIEALKQRAEQDEILALHVEAVKTAAARTGVPPGNPPDIFTSDTPALVTAHGRFPNLVYAYALTGDPALRGKIVDLLKMYLDNPHWAYAREVDSNMGAGNNMFAAGLLFDVVADELDPALRRQLAEKLLLHARRMWVLGHEKKALDVHKYWQQDPFNNHRWHRAAGMAATLLSVIDEEGVDARWLLEQFKQEMDFLLKWFPHDGDCHEGTGYQVFGFHYLAAASMMMDRVLGTDYLSHPGFRNAWTMQVYSDIPGAYSSLSFGDANNRIGQPGIFRSYEPSFFIGPRLSRDAAAQGALVDWYRRLATVNGELKAAGYPWLMLLYYDPTVPAGEFSDMTQHKLLADLGAAYLRDGMGADAKVVMLFKCGPYGGYSMNAYRNADNFRYVNIAHDDPDANSLSFAVDGDHILHPGTYFTNKVTANHNTVLVNGKGQRGEGSQYTQPIPNTDMTTLSYLTGWKAGELGRVIVEGEAGNAYPNLTRFRRSLVWLPGDYVLLLDDIAAPEEANIVWQAFSKTAKFTDPAAGKGYFEGVKGTRIPYQIHASTELGAALDAAVFKGRWGQELLNRTQFDTRASAARFVVLLDPWRRGDLELQVEGDRLRVRGEGIDDQWEWKPAGDLQTPGSLSGQRGGQPLIALTPADKAPQGD